MRFKNYILTTLLLMAACLSIKAQKADTLKVAANVHMPFSVGVVNKVVPSDYYYSWDLKWLNGSIWSSIANDDTKDGVDISKIVIPFTYKNNASPNRIYKLSVNVSRLARNGSILCSSADSLLYIKIIDRPIIEFETIDYGPRCSPSENLATENLDFTIKLTGYWGNWKVHYKVYEENRYDIATGAWLEVKDDNTVDFSIPLDKTFTNLDKWSGKPKNYFVRIDDFEYMDPKPVGVKLPEIVKDLYIKGKIVATFSIMPYQKIEIPLKRKEINKK